MKLKMLWVLITILATGCTASYKHSELKPITASLDGSQGVLISTPPNGWYENTQYRNSGKMTVNAVRAAFSKYASIVDVTDSCHKDDCLAGIDAKRYGYYVKPAILHWEERATEWSGKTDRIEIQIVVFDAETQGELTNATYTGKSKWATFGGDHPQDLLIDPTNQYVETLYR